LAHQLERSTNKDVAKLKREINVLKSRLAEKDTASLIGQAMLHEQQQKKKKKRSGGNKKSSSGVGGAGGTSSNKKTSAQDGGDRGGAEDEVGRAGEKPDGNENNNGNDEEEGGRGGELNDDDEGDDEDDDDDDDGPEEVDPNKISNLQERWDARFQQLVRFKVKHGHTNVTTKMDGPLHSWVRKQRTNKIKYDTSGGTKGLSDRQVQALNAIDFCWYIGTGRANLDHKNDVWNDNYKKLEILSREQGQIETCSDKALRKWIQNQRARRKLLEQKGEGKAKGMTWERVEKLNAINFVWDASYVFVNSSCLVPFSIYFLAFSFRKRFVVAHIFLSGLVTSTAADVEIPRSENKPRHTTATTTWKTTRGSWLPRPSRQ